MGDHWVMENLMGSLLVANGSLLDPNFRRTVVVVTEHSDEGAVGLILNRPAPVPRFSWVVRYSRRQPLCSRISRGSGTRAG